MIKEFVIQNRFHIHVYIIYIPCLSFFTSEANETRRLFVGANYFMLFFLYSVFNVFFSLSVKLNDNTVLLFIFMSILFT